ncbi:hypothetical protein [Marimonas lutisalis]|uniref:hypothetical protein n=1 Tax=Marimonas lutisalis TaxID=2545756 RepID=UPI001F458DED|nr:hypothetical protein [Marimonas lutisalis]
MRNFFLALLAMTALAGCAADPVWAPEEAIRAVQYRHPGPPRLTLFTMVSNDTGAGGHSSLMINGSQRVIWDPSGTFHHEAIPERNDLLYGITPNVADVYTRYHARETWHVIVQELDVSPEVAELALKLAQENGAVMNAYCAHSTSGILRRLPGMSHLNQTMYPLKLSAQFAELGGVRARTLHEYDSDDRTGVLDDWDPVRAGYGAERSAQTDATDERQQVREAGRQQGRTN